MARTKSLDKIVKKGSRLDALIALRDILATDIENCESKRDKVALVRQFREVMEDIEEIQGKPVQMSEPERKTALEIVRGKFKKQA